MRSVSILLLAPFFVAPAAFAQSASPDSQLTQALLTEIRQLRQDLQTAVATIQRVQIVMFRVQTESAQLARATQRLDDVRTRCVQWQSNIKAMTAQIEQTETRQRTLQDPNQQKSGQEMLSRLKEGLANLTGNDQECRLREAEAETQFRAEQSKMNDLQDQLDKLDKVLSAFTAK